MIVYIEDLHMHNESILKNKCDSPNMHRSSAIKHLMNFFMMSYHHDFCYQKNRRRAKQGRIQWTMSNLLSI